MLPRWPGRRVDHGGVRTGRRAGMKGRGRPVCAGQRVFITNPLASRAREVARDAQSTKNWSLKPADVVRRLQPTRVVAV